MIHHHHNRFIQHNHHHQYKYHLFIYLLSIFQARLQFNLEGVLQRWQLELSYGNDGDDNVDDEKIRMMMIRQEWWYPIPGWWERCRPCQGEAKGAENQSHRLKKDNSCNLWKFEFCFWTFFWYLLKPTREETRGREARNSTASKNRMKTKNSWLLLWFIFVFLFVFVCYEDEEQKQLIINRAWQKQLIKNEDDEWQLEMSDRVFGGRNQSVLIPNKKSWYRVERNPDTESPPPPLHCWYATWMIHTAFINDLKRKTKIQCNDKPSNKNIPS